MTEPERRAMQRPAAAAASPVVMGIDPGFSSIGWAAFSLEAAGPSFLTGSIFHTEKSAAKTNTLACDDNFVRAREISQELRAIVARLGVRIICAEAMSFPRSSSVAAKVAMTWGILANLTDSKDLPLLQATPQKVKKAVCGKISASKQEVEAAVAARFPQALAHIQALVATRAAESIGSRKKKFDSDLEHFWDACAVVVACQNSEHFRLARRLAG